MPWLAEFTGIPFERDRRFNVGLLYSDAVTGGFVDEGADQTV
jgi:hypothetical protein